MFKKKTKYNQLLDRELVTFIKSENNTNALGELFKRYSHLVASITLGILKDEEKSECIVHKIFRNIVTDLQNNDIKNINAWIYNTTTSHCFRVKNGNEEGLSDDFDDVLEKNLLLQKINKSLKGSISQINPNQKEVISLFYFEGFSYMEISEVTGLTNKEVKSHIKNGKKAIKSFMNNSEKK